MVSKTKNILVGVASMLFKGLINKPDLVIIDEQQKFSHSQREKLLTSTTHLLEVFTTPIPRTTALIKFGALKVWKITKNHTKKTIYSHLSTRSVKPPHL